MIEAAGHAYYKNYFEDCSQRLKPDGIMLLQSITIADQRYQSSKKEVDFIHRYIFPGGSLPSVSVITKNIADMRFYQLEDIGLHYATGLSLRAGYSFDLYQKIKLNNAAKSSIPAKKYLTWELIPRIIYTCGNKSHI